MPAASGLGHPSDEYESPSELVFPISDASCGAFDLPPSRYSLDHTEAIGNDESMDEAGVSQTEPLTDAIALQADLVDEAGSESGPSREVASPTSDASITAEIGSEPTSTDLDVKLANAFDVPADHHEGLQLSAELLITEHTPSRAETAASIAIPSLMITDLGEASAIGEMAPVERPGVDDADWLRTEPEQDVISMPELVDRANAPTDQGSTRTELPDVRSSLLGSSPESECIDHESIATPQTPGAGAISDTEFTDSGLDMDEPKSTAAAFAFEVQSAPDAGPVSEVDALATDEVRHGMRVTEPQRPPIEHADQGSERQANDLCNDVNRPEAGTEDHAPPIDDREPSVDAAPAASAHEAAPELKPAGEGKHEEVAAAETVAGQGKLEDEEKKPASRQQEVKEEKFAAGPKESKEEKGERAAEQHGAKESVTAEYQQITNVSDLRTQDAEALKSQLQVPEFLLRIGVLILVEPISPKYMWCHPEELLTTALGVAAAPNAFSKFVGTVLELVTTAATGSPYAGRAVGFLAENFTNLLIQNDFKSEADGVRTGIGQACLIGRAAIDIVLGRAAESSAIKTLGNQYGMANVDEAATRAIDRLAPVVNDEVVMAPSVNLPPQPQAAPGPVPPREPASFWAVLPEQKSAAWKALLDQVLGTPNAAPVVDQRLRVEQTGCPRLVTCTQERPCPKCKGSRWR
jgi:hypothetical protein